MKDNNVFSEKVKWYNDFLATIYCFSPNKNYFHTRVENGKLNVSIKSQYASVLQNKCSAQIPSLLAWSPEPKAPLPPRTKRTFNSLYFVREQLKKGSLSDEQLKRALKIVNNSILAFSFLREDGRRAFFTSYTKGTQRYGKKQASIAQDYIKNHVNAGWESFFLTLTCDPKKYENRLDAWQNYKANEVRPVLENMRKHKGLEYIGFMESTKKGYPHIHLVLFFPKGSISGYDKMKNGSVLYYGKLYKEINKRKNSKINKLIVLKGDNVKYYLTKYVTKDTESKVLSLENKKDSFTAEERKNALGLIITKAVAIRTKICCKDRSIAQLEKIASQAHTKIFSNQEFAFNFVRKLKQGTVTPRDFARLRAVLIKLCINSPFKCGKCIKSMSYRQFFQIFNKDCNSVDANNEKNSLLFDNSSVELGCKGCFLIAFIHLIKECSEKSQKVVVDDEKNLIYLDNLSNTINVRNSKQFFFRVSQIIDFYFSRFFVDGFSYSHAKTRNTSNRQRIAKNRQEDIEHMEYIEPGLYECVITNFEKEVSSEGVCFKVTLKLLNTEYNYPITWSCPVERANFTAKDKLLSYNNFSNLCKSIGLKTDAQFNENARFINKKVCVSFMQTSSNFCSPHRFFKSIYADF